MNDNLLKEIKEQLQEDLICLLDGQPDELIDAVCDTVIKRINSYIANN